MHLGRALLCGWLASCIGWLVASSSLGADAADAKAKANLAFIAAAEAGDDFRFQGEYAFRGGCGWGVQVIALGDGKFDAVVHDCGLPGTTTCRGRQTKLSGTLQDGVLELSGAAYRARVTPQSCQLWSANGCCLASLPKIERVAPTMHLSPPPGALVLFDGTPSDQLEGAHVTKDGYLATGTLTKFPIQDFQMHIEFRIPYMPYARGQGRGNSGVYIQQRYEVQILDSFGLEGIENECGALYRQVRPSINMCFPPLSWQTYDIYFQAARWSPSGEKLQNARLTLFHNGVAVHDQREIVTKTGAGKEESPEGRPVLLQHHGNPVAFRNVWIVPTTPHTQLAAQASTAPVRHVRYVRPGLLLGWGRWRGR